MQVSHRDLLPSEDPDHVCRGTVPLKNGRLTCGCPLQADAPEPLTHREIAGFDSLSTEVLRNFFFGKYMSPAFNNCRNQNVKIMFTEQPLQQFVDISFEKANCWLIHVFGIHQL